MSEMIIEIYNYMKTKVIESGYESEIDWCKNIPPLEEIDKIFFFREYCWVVINSGMKEQVARNIFKRFWNNGTYNFDEIKHPNKNKSMLKVHKSLEKHFYQLKESKNRLKYLESLPHIGPITKYHLARNLGLDYAKPDRHLVRIMAILNYNNVQDLCNKISRLVDDKIGVVDIVIWRFANLFENYLDVIQKFIQRGAIA
jgi:hypothetical protein